MRIQHYMTLDQGRGPVTLISIDLEGKERMLRIQHQAVYGGVSEVDPAKTREFIDSIPKLDSAHQALPSEMQRSVSDAVTTWLSNNGHQVAHMRWKDGTEGVTFRTAEDATLYDDINATAAVNKPAATRRRVMMS